MPAIRPVPIKNPFNRDPIRYANVPVPQTPPEIIPNEPLQVVLQSSFVHNGTGAQGTFPQGNRVSIFTFSQPVGLLNVSLSTSVSNAATDAPMAVWVAKNTGATASLNNSSDALVEHVIVQAIANSFRSGIAFSDELAPKFGSGESLALYISSSGTGVAGNAWVVVCTVRYFQTS